MQGAAYTSILAIMTRHVLSFILFIVIHGLARLSWSAVECVDAGIDMDWGSRTSARMPRAGLGVFAARCVFHIVVVRL